MSEVDVAIAVLFLGAMLGLWFGLMVKSGREDRDPPSAVPRRF